MAQQDGAAKKNPAVAALHSHFIVGSVSEENSEDEIQGKVDLQLEEKEARSLSPSSGSSDSTYEMGFDHIDGPIHNLRSDESRPARSASPSSLSVFIYNLSAHYCQKDTFPAEYCVYDISYLIYGYLFFCNYLFRYSKTSYFFRV